MIMERKIGETFEYEGKTLQVKEIEEHTCKGCFFGDGCDTELHIGVTGECLDRTDGKEVIYVEVPEQPAPQKETKLNLLEILCYCPEGTEFWSPLLGDVRFICVGKTTIPVEDKNGHSWDINPDSTMTIDGITSAEPMLFPSKEQRDWGKVHYQTPLEKLPKSWEEFCDTHNIRDGEAYCDDHCSIRELTAGGDARQGRRLQLAFQCRRVPPAPRAHAAAPTAQLLARRVETCKRLQGIRHNQPE